MAAIILVAAGCMSTKARESEPVTVTVCELLAHPEQYSGKQVIIRAMVITTRRMAITLSDCVKVLLVFPSDPEAKPKPQFHLVEDENFNKLNNAQRELVPQRRETAGRITATFEGRFDSVFVMRKGRKVKRDPRSIRLAADEVRLVLHRVSDVEVKPASPAGADPGR